MTSLTTFLKMGLDIFYKIEKRNILQKNSKKEKKKKKKKKENQNTKKKKN